MVIDVKRAEELYHYIREIEAILYKNNINVSEFWDDVQAELHDDKTARVESVTEKRLRELNVRL